MIDPLLGLATQEDHAKSGIVLEHVRRLLLLWGADTNDLSVTRRTRDRLRHPEVEHRGLGRDVWSGVDVEAYLRQLRNEWSDSSGD